MHAFEYPQIAVTVLAVATALGLTTLTAYRRPREIQASRLGEFDGLTGLVSRACLARRIDTATRNSSAGVALIFVDLDNFKYVNDTLGYDVGDIILTRIADRLRDCVSDDDVVARLSGDEFAILLTERPPLTVEAVAHLIRDAMGPAILVEGRGIRIGASLGIAIWEEGISGSGELMRRADIALNSVKDTNRGGFRVFDRDMECRLRRRQELEQDLRQALAENAFELHYQPIVCLATNDVVAFEALIRWRHASRGLVSPAEFIPVAEELGLIVPIGDWVLRRACRDAMRWPERIKLSVNFSRAQFEMPDARLQLETALWESGLAPQRLQLEITETTVMADLDRANVLLDEFRELGVEIAMDDFGTGYSSLSCLRNCGFDRLKIDRAFIRDLTTSRQARAILTMIVKLAATLGIQTTAEGVETSEQFEIVKEEGCGTMQGIFFSSAKPADEVQKYFQSAPGGSGAAA